MQVENSIQATPHPATATPPAKVAMRYACTSHDTVGESIKSSCQGGIHCGRSKATCSIGESIAFYLLSDRSCPHLFTIMT